MEWGGSAGLRDALEAMGEEAPPSPTLPDWLVWVWRAWQRLNLDRPWRACGMGPPIPERIPWRDIRQWCEFYDRAGWEVDFMAACFAEMDRVFLEHYLARMAPATP